MSLYVEQGWLDDETRAMLKDFVKFHLDEATLAHVLAWLREQWRCTTCGGSGLDMSTPYYHEGIGNQYEPCPDCVDGWVIPDEIVEAVATVIGNTQGTHPDRNYGLAQGVLVAWLTALEAE